MDSNKVHTVNDTQILPFVIQNQEQSNILCSTFLKGHFNYYYYSDSYGVRSSLTDYLDFNEVAPPAGHYTLVEVSLGNSLDSSPRFFMPMVLREVNGYLTQLPSALVESLGVPIELSNISTNRWSINRKEFYTPYGTQWQKKAEINFLGKHNVILDTVSTVSCLKSPLYAKALAYKEAFIASAPRRLNVLKTHCLYRGASNTVLTLGTQTKNQVLKGGSFFLYKQIVNVYDPETRTISQREILQLGIFTSVTNIIKYSNSRLLMKQLLTDIKNGNEHVGNPTAYEKENIARLKGITHYWDKPSQIASQFFNCNMPKGILNFNVLSQENLEQTVSNDYFHQTTIQSYLSSSEEAIALAKADKAIELNNHRITQEKINKERKEEDIVYCTNKIKAYLRSIEDYKESIRGYERNILTSNESISIFTKASETLVKQKEDCSKTYKEKITESLESIEKKNFTENLKKTGIIVLNIGYYNKAEGHRDIKDFPEVVNDPSFALHKVHFVTTKPLPIYVDNYKTITDCEEDYEEAKGKKVKAGGSYEVILTYLNHTANVTLRLASAKAVYGVSGNQATIHPHCESVYIDSQDTLLSLYTSWRSPCLGDSSSSITAAFQKNNPRMVILGFLSWLTSCCSSDYWGKKQSWFPSYSSLKTTESLLDACEIPEEIPEETVEETSETVTEEDIERGSVLIQNQVVGEVGPLIEGIPIQAGTGIEINEQAELDMAILQEAIVNGTIQEILPETVTNQPVEPVPQGGPALPGTLNALEAEDLYEDQESEDQIIFYSVPNRDLNIESTDTITLSNDYLPYTSLNTIEIPEEPLEPLEEENTL